MKLTARGSQVLAYWTAVCLMLLLSWNAHGQSCQTASEIDAANKTAIQTTAQRYFEMASKGDAASLRQNAIASLASDFSGIEGTIKENQANLSGAQGAIKSYFLLDASGAAPIPNAVFYCGVFGRTGQTANTAEFFLNNLPPAKYAVALFDATSSAGRTMFTEILQQSGTDWKLAGLYIKPAQVAGHDSGWFLARAREYKAKGQMHNAWFYFEEAVSLISPVSFMSTLATDTMADEAQQVQPTDVPVGGKTVDLATGGVTYKLTEMFRQPVSNDLDLVVKYQSANVADPNRAYQDNVAVMKAVLQKWPELREAFAGIVARGVDTTGRDYGTLLAMKDIK